MLVIRANDFSIPSDENDYDELVAFADTMANIEQFEAIPKADYEARLKADMLAMLTDIQLEIEEIEMNNNVPFGFEPVNKFYEGVSASSKVIQQKIDALKESENG